MILCQNLHFCLDALKKEVNFSFILFKKDKSIIFGEKMCLKSYILYGKISPYNKFSFVEVSSFCIQRRLKIVHFLQKEEGK